MKIKLCKVTELRRGELVGNILMPVRLPRAASYAPGMPLESVGRELPSALEVFSSSLLDLTRAGTVGRGSETVAVSWVAQAWSFQIGRGGRWSTYTALWSLGKYQQHRSSLYLNFCYSAHHGFLPQL